MMYNICNGAIRWQIPEMLSEQARDCNERKLYQSLQLEFPVNRVSGCMFIDCVLNVRVFLSLSLSLSLSLFVKHTDRHTHTHINTHAERHTLAATHKTISHTCAAYTKSCAIILPRMIAEDRCRLYGSDMLESLDGGGSCGWGV